jgi:type 1 glutamine amidotransferase/nicotinamidase-related amidase
MWDSHHSLNAVRRAEEMAPRMNDFLGEARRRGALIIHAPSSCMQPYQDHPARQRAVQAPWAANLPPDIGQWCHSIPAEEQALYPIDQSDGGEDDDPQELQQWHAELREMGRNPRAPWTRQTDLLEIHNQDAISDSGEEIWNLMEQRGIRHVILLGVHTNMCVLGRPFGLRQMVRNGRQAVLVRDLTDTMYNPQRWPYVSHHSGTDLIVEHIERHVCPTITSDQLLGGQPFRFDTDRRKHVVLVMAEDEYRTEETLSAFARRHLQRDFRLSFVYEDAADANRLPGLEWVSDPDVVVISVRRRLLPRQQLDVFRRWIGEGRAVVGLRTASHAFDRSGSLPEDRATWPEFDREVLGGNYQGHHGNRGPEAPSTYVRAVPRARAHPILHEFPEGEIRTASWLYKTRPLEAGAQALMMGRVGDLEPHEPVSWTHQHAGGGRVFYTSLGHPEDFQLPAFQRLLANGIYWAAGLEIPDPLPDSPHAPAPTSSFGR